MATRAASIRLLSLSVLLLPFPFASAFGQESKGVHVCLGIDNLLRFTTGERCPQGQRMFRLAEVEDEVGIAKEKDDPPNAVVADLKTKMDLLRSRVANLETEARKSESDPGGSGVSQVKAPFEVVDKSGRPIFVVADAPHSSVARQGRIQIARAVGDGFSMVVRSQAGKGVVGLGELIAGGAMYVADQAGKTRVYASAENGLQLFNNSDLPVAQFKVGPGNAGQMWLYDPSGVAMVMAGTLSTGVGAVEVGPGRKCVPDGMLRVPDCIRGRTQ